MNKRDENSSLEVPAVGKAIALLETIAHERGLRFTDIHERLGMPKSSTHRLISTMCKLALIRERSSGGYDLGHKLLELASIANENSDLQRDAMPLLREFAKRVQLSCHLGVLEQGEAVYIARVEGARNIIVRSHVGQRFPVNCSALGKSLVAWLAPERCDNVIASLAFKSYTPKTISNVVEFRRDLVETRRRGWAIDDEEQMLNCRCIAAPIRDGNGVVVAALSVNGTLAQVNDDRVEVLAEQVIAAARSISEAVYGVVA